MTSSFTSIRIRWGQTSGSIRFQCCIYRHLSSELTTSWFSPTRHVYHLDRKPDSAAVRTSLFSPVRAACANLQEAAAQLCTAVICDGQLRPVHDWLRRQSPPVPPTRLAPNRSRDLILTVADRGASDQLIKRVLDLHLSNVDGLRLSTDIVLVDSNGVN